MTWCVWGVAAREVAAMAMGWGGEASRAADLGGV